MKKLSAYIGGLFLVLGVVLCSCSRERDYELERTYDDYTGLSFTLNDSVMHGCTLNLYTDGTEYAKIEVEGAKVDLSGLLSMIAGMISIPDTKATPKTSVVSTCVLPGSPKVVIDDIILKPSDGNRFSGNGESDNCTFSYTGTVRETGIELKLSDVKMKRELPLPMDKIKVYPVQNGFINIDWKYMNGDKPVDFHALLLEEYAKSITKIDFEDLKKEGVILPMLGQLLSQQLHGMTVYKSGDVTLALADHDTKIGTAQYVISNESDMRIYLNIPEVVVSLLTRDGAAGGDIEKIIQDLIPILGQYLAKMINEGILIHYSMSLTGMSVTLDSATVVRVMNLLSLALSDEMVIGMIQNLLQERLPQELHPLLPLIMNGIKALPANLEVTEKLDISFNFSLTPAPDPAPEF